MIGFGLLGLLAAMAALQVTSPSTTLPASDTRVCKGKYLPPKPRGNPGAWVTSADYPSSFLRIAQRGTVGILILVGQDGRVSDVRITSNTAGPELGAETIRLVKRRARFFPALQNCKPVQGEFATAVRWELPE